MRVNVYAEEMTDKVEIITKEVEGLPFTGVRFYLELPVTTPDGQVQGPFVHRTTAQGVDDDSSAVTFWGKRDLRKVLRTALAKLDIHYMKRYGVGEVEGDDSDGWTGTWCPECGPGVAVGDDGLCQSCGATAVGEGVEEALKALRAAARVPEAPLSREVLKTVLALAKGNTFGLKSSHRAMDGQEAIEAVERYLGEKR
jgi:hypothetical protein